jgi:beta-barrel assembly-enhancing protease
MSAPPSNGRRLALRWGCAHCVAGAAWAVAPLARAQTAPASTPWQAPPRLPRPDLASDEGGLWALVDREETRMRRSSFLIKDSGLRDYLTGLACKLGGAHCADTRVYPMRTPWFNASMAPNGMMQVWTGLLLRMDNEAQLVAVLGHEMGHYLQRHSLARLQDAKSRSAFMSLMAPLGAVGLMGQMAALAGMASYSRDHETEADMIGVALMRQGGWDPREAAKVWDNLRAELTAGAGGDPAKRSVLFASHPPTDARQAALNALAAGDSGGELGAETFQARIEPFMADMLDDELRRAQYDETIALMTRLSTRRPQRADLRFARGEAHRLRAQDKDKDLDAALADYQAAETLHKPPPQVFRGLGFVHRQQGRKAEAVSAFARYLQTAPTAPDAALIQSYLDEMKT